MAERNLERQINKKKCSPGRVVRAGILYVDQPQASNMGLASLALNRVIYMLMESLCNCQWVEKQPPDGMKRVRWMGLMCN